MRIPTAGGPPLTGRMYGATASNGVVLVPDVGRSRPALDPLARDLAAPGIVVLVFELPTGGTPVPSVAAVQAAAAFLRSRGVEKVALVGEGAGGAVALAAAAVDRISGVATLSSPTVYRGAGGDVDALAALARIDRPVLFIAALGDTDAAGAALRLYDASRDPRSRLLAPGNAQGADLLRGPDAAETLDLLRDFLRRAFAPLTARRFDDTGIWSAASGSWRVTAGRAVG